METYNKFVINLHFILKGMQTKKQLFHTDFIVCWALIKTLRFCVFSD